jgi:hypothetical protein
LKTEAKSIGKASVFSKTEAKSIGKTFTSNIPELSKQSTGKINFVFYYLSINL